jgi:ferredoxin
MTYVVTENCIACTYMDCVAVCPMDCFHEGRNMLVIDPETCIDCGVCEPVCPSAAIRPGTDPGLFLWHDLNRKYAQLWPTITTRRSRTDDPDLMNGVPDKLAMLSEEPGGTGE